MVGLSLLLLILAQSDQTAPPGTGNDLVFEIAVEDSFRPDLKKLGYDRLVGSRNARLIRNLGCTRADCRDEAQESLEALGFDWEQRHTLIWASFARDAEIRRRARIIMGHFVCPLCEGWGLCPECQGRNLGDGWTNICEFPATLKRVGESVTRWIHACPSCRGTGARQVDPFWFWSEE